MSVSLSLFAGVGQQFFDNSGVPLAGGLLYTYEAGTTTPAATYTSASGATPQTNPIVLDAAGRVPSGEIWLTSGIAYKFVLKTSAGVTIATYDNVDSAVTYTALAASTGSAYVGHIASGTGAVARTAQSKLRDTVSVKDFGAVGDGVADDTVAIQLALSSGARSVYMPPARYRCASGIIIPPNVSLYSTSFIPGNNGAAGTALVFDLAVTVCVTLGGGTFGNVGGSVKGFCIVRAAGTIPSGSIGLLNENTYATVIAEIGIFRHAIGVSFKGDRASAGIASFIEKLCTGTISDTHVLVDTFPETRFSQCRFGQNGAFDLTCNSFVRVTGGSTTNAANGPNSVVMNNCQFNQGQNTVATWLDFASQQAGSISDITLWQFDSCYIETVSTGIRTDATWTYLTRLQISNTTFNMNAGIPFLSLNAATTLDSWALNGNIFNGSFTLAPTAQFNFINVSDNSFLGNVSVTGVSNSTCVFADNIYRGSLTIAGAFALGTGQFIGGIVVGTLTNTTAANKAWLQLSSYNEITNWIPSVAFGGASVGITYAVRQATYQIIGRKVFVEVSITLTSKGTSTGLVSITGLPIPDDLSFTNGAGGGVVSYLTGVSGLPICPLVASVNVSIITLYSATATGIIGIFDTNFTNTTIIKFQCSYTRA